jgi:hypothetical protein
LLWLLVLLANTVLAAATDVNVSVYNYTSGRLAVHLNYQWYCVLEPQEYRGLTLPWDEFQTLEFYRYPQGSINTSFKVLVNLGRFHPVELIYVSDRDLP